MNEVKGRNVLPVLAAIIFIENLVFPFLSAMIHGSEVSLQAVMTPLINGSGTLVGFFFATVALWSVGMLLSRLLFPTAPAQEGGFYIGKDEFRKSASILAFGLAVFGMVVFLS